MKQWYLGLNSIFQINLTGRVTEINCETFFEQLYFEAHLLGVAVKNLEKTKAYKRKMKTIVKAKTIMLRLKQ